MLWTLLLFSFSKFTFFCRHFVCFVWFVCIFLSIHVLNGIIIIFPTRFVYSFGLMEINFNRTFPLYVWPTHSCKCCCWWWSWWWWMPNKRFRARIRVLFYQSNLKPRTVIFGQISVSFKWTNGLDIRSIDTQRNYEIVRKFFVFETSIFSFDAIV